MCVCVCVGGGGHKLVCHLSLRGWGPGVLEKYLVTHGGGGAGGGVVKNFVTQIKMYPPPSPLIHPILIINAQPDNKF